LQKNTGGGRASIAGKVSCWGVDYYGAHMRIRSCQDMGHLLTCLYTLNATSKIVGVLAIHLSLSIGIFFSFSGNFFSFFEKNQKFLGFKKKSNEKNSTNFSFFCSWEKKIPNFSISQF
jgi:hypothetical protein